jgi:fructoselysine-6-P-deglycase FrlB-like protein
MAADHGNPSVSARLIVFGAGSSSAAAKTAMLLLDLSAHVLSAIPICAMIVSRPHGHSVEK